MSKKLTTEEFIRRAKEVHGDKYDYSKTKYVNSTTPVTIICHQKDENGVEHGEFEQKPFAHLYGQGCKQCSHRSYKYTTKEWVDIARKIHGDKYDYSKVEYVNSKTPVTIICPVHKEFLQNPHNHLNGSGCLECENEKRKVNRYTFDEFVTRARKVHGDKYRYDESTFINMRTKMRIYCTEKDENGKEHGWFEQQPGEHIRGHGCKQCGCNRASLKNQKQKYRTSITTEDFIKRAIEVHGNRYDYSKVDYKNIRTKVVIVCPIHGPFEQTPDAHLNGGYGCKQCAIENGNNFESNGEQEISNYIKENNIKILTRNRKIIYPFEIDILIPEKNIAFEYDGLFWHSDYSKNNNYHLNKTNECLSKGIQLYHIFEDEWVYKREIVESRIKQKIGLFDNEILPKCICKEINFEQFCDFMKENSLQDINDNDKTYGLFCDNVLLSVAGLKRGRVMNFCMYRKCTYNNMYYNIVQYICNLLNLSEIEIQIDKRIDNINEFNIKNYIKLNMLKPFGYSVKGDKRLIGCNTEYKIYNCGYDVYVLKNLS